MIYEFFLANLVYVYLFGSIVRRYYKNKDIAKMKRNKRICSSLRNKIILVALWSSTNFFIIIFAFIFPDNFWLTSNGKENNRWFSLIYVLQTIILIFQILMMRFEYLKKLPYAWYTHYLFWLITLLFHICFLINTLINQCSGKDVLDCLISYIFDGLRILFSLLLTIYSFFKFQDLTTGQDYLLSSESKFVFSAPERILIESVSFNKENNFL